MFCLNSLTSLSFIERPYFQPFDSSRFFSWSVTLIVSKPLQKWPLFSIFHKTLEVLCDFCGFDVTNVTDRFYWFSHLTFKKDLLLRQSFLKYYIIGWKWCCGNFNVKCQIGKIVWKKFDVINVTDIWKSWFHVFK